MNPSTVDIISFHPYAYGQFKKRGIKRNKFLNMAIIAIFFFFGCMENTRDHIDDTQTAPDYTLYSGPWGTVKVSESYQHIGSIRGEFDKSIREDPNKKFPWTYTRHVFVDKSEQREMITNILTVIIDKPKYKGGYGREPKFHSERLYSEAKFKKTKFDEMEVLTEINSAFSLNYQDLYLLNEKGFKLLGNNNAYSVKFRKLLGGRTRADVVYFEINSSAEQIIDHAKKAVTFTK